MVVSRILGFYVDWYSQSRRFFGCADVICHAFGAERACDGFCASAGCDLTVLFGGFVVLGFGLRALADDGLGKLAGLPEQEDLLQAVEDAREDGGLWVLNSAWTNGVAGFKPGTGISSLVVPSSYLTGVMLMILAIGALVGAIGSAIAASRFLDV